jgi:hypothetical protein
MFRCAAVVNHPVKVIKVFLECSHNRKSDAKNEGLSNAEKIDAPNAFADDLKSCSSALKSSKSQSSSPTFAEDGGRL